MSVINTNILSLVTQNNLTKSQGAMNTAIERLSSGMRINSAKDDAAGQAIANRFTASIKGLTQASRNANDGISMAQTTEGALNEVNTNLQRIRELTVQSANGSNSDADKASMQAEITQRMAEINRTSRETDFNGVKVLSSSAKELSVQVGAYDGETISIDLTEISSQTLGLEGFSVVSGIDTFKVAARATSSAAVGATPGNTGSEETAVVTATSDLTSGQTFIVGGLTYTSGAGGTTKAELATAFANLAAGTPSTTPAKGAFSGTLTGYTTGPASGDSVTFTATAVGNQTDLVAVGTGSTGATVVITQGTASVATSGSAETASMTATATGLTMGQTFIVGGLTYTSTAATSQTELVAAFSNLVNGTQSIVPAKGTFSGALAGYTTGTASGSVITFTATTVGNKTDLAASGTGTAGATVAVAAQGVDAVAVVPGTAAKPGYTGADKDNVFTYSGGTEGGTSGSVIKETVGTVTSYYKATIATDGAVTRGDALSTGVATLNPLKTLDAALKAVDTLRGSLGAVQNRFDSVIANLGTTIVNLSSSRSRIEDADYATEVSNMTRAQILQQAGTSVLAKANQSTEGVMSLLR